MTPTKRPSRPRHSSLSSIHSLLSRPSRPRLYSLLTIHYSLFTLLYSLFSILSASASVSSRELNEGWRFRQQRSDIWYPATVPGTVHTDLMANDLIEDPFFRLNERSVQWVDKEDWWYETTFTATAEEVEAQHQQLVFHGLDTYAKVYLNHQELLYANNMHRTWVCDVRGILREGENLLEVQFDSPIKVDLPKYDRYDYTFNTGPDQSQNGGVFHKTLSIFARKAGYHYGWDWGPRLVTSGIWRPIELRTWSGQRIASVQHIQQEVNPRKAQLQTAVEVLSDADTPATLIITANGKTVASKKVLLKEGENKLTLDYAIKNPRLWWTNGLGEPYLYDFDTQLTVGNETVDLQQLKLGLRSLKLVNTPDAEGHTLHFELNGKPLFAKGADMVPLDNFLPRVTDAKYRRLVEDAVAVNMNMLRVWGGGIYEDDRFYDYCDSLGILVWQDFAFACSTYPADEAFIENIRQEAVDNVKRLRNHTSLALLCGNNECQDVYYGWGGRQKYYMEKGVEALTTRQFKDMYFRTLPQVVAEYAPNIPYRPSSPYAFEDTPSDGRNGDSHYWGVWHGRDSIGHYNIERSRFFSEYGFQSFPEFESVKIYAPQERDWAYNSEAMMSHQRAGSYANGLIKSYMEQEYRVPQDFPAFLYVGMLLQGDAIKTAVEAHRRDMPHCMGTLVWQMNDCWPVASWAGRDYYDRWKAQHYYCRQAMDSVLVSPVTLGDTLSVWVVNDLRHTVAGTLTLTAMTLDGQVLNTQSVEYAAPELSSKRVMAHAVKPLVSGHDRGEVIFVADFDTPEHHYTNIGYSTRQRNMRYTPVEITRQIVPSGDGYEVTLSAPSFARGVFLSLPGIDNFFSDNYFDLLPGQSRTIHVRSCVPLSEFNSQLRLLTLGDIYATMPL